MMDRSEDADMIVFKMGEREKTFFQKLGMDTGIKKVSFREVAEKIMARKLNSDGFEDPRERFFLEQYKKRKEERRIAEEKAKAEKKEKEKEKSPRNEPKQQNGTSQLETVAEEGFPALDLNSNELHVPGSTRKSSVFNDSSSYATTDRRLSTLTETDRSVITDVLQDDVTKDILNSCQSRKSTASLRMRPRRLDTVNEFDFDEGEGIELKEDGRGGGG